MDREYLTLEHIEKSFGGNRALKDVSFSVKKGTVHVLAGENGAGKSTVLKILCGNYHADSGEIYLEGNKSLLRTKTGTGSWNSHGISRAYAGKRADR